MDGRVGRDRQHRDPAPLPPARSGHLQRVPARRHARGRDRPDRSDSALAQDPRDHQPPHRRLVHRSRGARRRRIRLCRPEQQLRRQRLLRRLPDHQRTDHRDHLRIHGARPDAHLLDPRHRQLQPWRVLHGGRNPRVLHHRGLAAGNHPPAGDRDVVRDRLRSRGHVRAAVPDTDVHRPHRQAGRVRHPHHLRACLHSSVLRAGDCRVQSGESAPVLRLSPHPAAVGRRALAHQDQPGKHAALRHHLDLQPPIRRRRGMRRGAAGPALLPASHLDRQGAAGRQPGSGGGRHRRHRPEPDEHAGVRARSHDRGARRVAARAGVLVAAAGRQHSGDAIVRDRGPGGTRIAAGSVRGRDPGRPRRGGRDRLHPGSAEGGVLHPGLRDDRVDAHPASAPDGLFGRRFASGAHGKF